jgi:glycosyltransferase involved in cell wall biosynthesis
MAPALSDVPFVLDMVDVDSEKWRALADVVSGPKRWVYRREAEVLAKFEHRAMTAAHATLAVNEKEAAALHMSHPDARVVVVQNGIALDAFSPPSPPSPEQTAVFCGVLDYAPNEEAALRLSQSIWPIVRRTVPDAHLLCVGANPTDRLLAAAANDPSITVTGTVPDVRPYLWQSAIGLAPLNVARGLQNKVLEALAAGLPVVVSPAVAEGLPATVRHAVVVADTNEAAAQAICTLFKTSPDARRQLASSANLGALTWDRQLSPLWDELCRAIGTPARHGTAQNRHAD